MADEKLYEIALDEFSKGSRDSALMAKALVRADGDTEKQKFEYVKLRVAQMKVDQIRRVPAAVGSKGQSAARATVETAGAVGSRVVLGVATVVKAAVMIGLLACPHRVFRFQF